MTLQPIGRVRPSMLLHLLESEKTVRLLLTGLKKLMRLFRGSELDKGSEICTGMNVVGELEGC